MYMYIYTCVPMTDRLVLSVAHPSYEQVDQLGAKDETVKG